MFGSLQADRAFLANLPLRDDLGLSQLAPALVVICLVLGYLCYTDIRSRRIPNAANVALGLVALATVPLAFEDLASFYLGAGIIMVVALLSAAVGAVALGDLKLYWALCLILGKAALVLMFLSWVIIIIYSLPIIIRTIRRNRRSGQKAKPGQRLGSAPGGPGIALAFPLTLVVCGLEPVYGLALAGVIVAAGLASWGLKALDERTPLEE